jgi:hypothetical protein
MMIRLIGWAALALAAFTGTAAASEPTVRLTAETRQKGIERLAVEIKGRLGDPREVYVDAFDGPVTGEKDVGIKVEVEAALRNLDVKIGPGKGVGKVSGRMAAAEDAGRLSGYQLKVTLDHSGKKEPDTFEVTVKDVNDARGLVGDVGEFLPSPDVADRNVSRKAPQVEDKKVRAGPSSPYAVEIWVADDQGQFKPREITERKAKTGYFEVDLKVGESFYVQVYNESNFEACTNVYLDGVSRFFRLGDNKPVGDLVLGRGRGGEKGTPIDGYVRKIGPDGQAARFLACRFEEAVAHELGLSADKAPEIGTISVTFAACWEKGKPKPENEQPPGQSAAGGIKEGKLIPAALQLVPREVGQVRATIKIHYGSKP